MVHPYVVAHTAVSVDGATTGFEPNVQRFYELAAGWDEDVTLAGADTILAQEPALASAPRPGPAATGPLLAVVDSRYRVRQWEALRDVGHWSEVLALRSRVAPPHPAEPAVPELVVGDDRVDLAAALESLGRHDGVRVVRVDSGGALTGALLRAGLIDEVSLLVHPLFAGAAGPNRWYGAAPPPAVALDLSAAESFDDGTVWLRYRIASK